MKIFSLVILLSSMIAVGCNTGIRTFHANSYIKKCDCIVITSDKKALRSLKTEWVELYNYILKGHMVNCLSKKGNSLIFSEEFHHYLVRNELRIYELDFFQEYNNLIAIFGTPSDGQVFDGMIMKQYSYFVVDDTCQTCQKSFLLAFYFNAKTKKLLKY